jgi:hypothetical protein
VQTTPSLQSVQTGFSGSVGLVGLAGQSELLREFGGRLCEIRQAAGSEEASRMWLWVKTGRTRIEQMSSVVANLAASRIFQTACQQARRARRKIISFLQNYECCTIV